MKAAQDKISRDLSPESWQSLLADLVAVLTSPSPDALWALRATLLEAGLSGDDPILFTLDHFQNFLVELAAKATARQYSHFASMLDLGAVAGVAVQNLVHSGSTEAWWRRLLVGAFSESLMLAAARQYVKAWEGEMQAGYEGAAWYLYACLWSLSAAQQPELSAAERRQRIDELLLPLRQPDTAGAVKAALACRLFQIVLLLQLRTGGEQPASANGPEADAS